MRIPKEFTKFIDEVGEKKIKKLISKIKQKKGSGKLGKALKDNWKTLLVSVGIPLTRMAYKFVKYAVNKKYGNTTNYESDYGIDVIHDDDYVYEDNIPEEVNIHSHNQGKFGRLGSGYSGGTSDDRPIDIKTHNLLTESQRLKMIEVLEDIEQQEGGGKEDRIRRRNERKQKRTDRRNARKQKRADRKASRKAKDRKSLKDWLEGRTKFKPSKLLRIISNIASVFSFIPGISLLSGGIAAATGVASSMLRQEGRGLRLPGDYDQHGQGIPSGIKKFIKKNIDVASKILHSKAMKKYIAPTLFLQ